MSDVAKKVERACKSGISLPPLTRKRLVAEVQAMEDKLAQVREAVTMLEKARSDEPFMKTGPLLTVLADFVERIEEALNG